jgi:hypothetical protein
MKKYGKIFDENEFEIYGGFIKILVNIFSK